MAWDVQVFLVWIVGTDLAFLYPSIIRSIRGTGRSLGLLSTHFVRWGRFLQFTFFLVLTSVVGVITAAVVLGPMLTNGPVRDDLQGLGFAGYLFVAGLAFAIGSLVTEAVRGEAGEQHSPAAPEGQLKRRTPEPRPRPLPRINPEDKRCN